MKLIKLKGFFINKMTHINIHVVQKTLTEMVYNSSNYNTYNRNFPDQWTNQIKSKVLFKVGTFTNSTNSTHT